MRRKVYTIEEMEEKARQGYFWEYDLKEWLHISQVDTEEKARRFLKKRNPIRVMKLAQNYPEAVAPRLTGFLAWIYDHTMICSSVLALMALIVFILPAICGNPSGDFYNEHIGIGCAVLATLLPPITVYFILLLKIWNIDLDDASFILCAQAEALKEGFIYDEFGRMRSFQK